MTRRTSWWRTAVLTAACGLVMLPAGAHAQAQATADGIPVESELVRSKCGGCHKPDASNRMTRISWRRASPENWERTVERMITLNKANVTPADARTIVKYLADHNGLAPEEARPIAFEFERRLIEWTYDGDKDVATLCGGCHAFSRVLAERRTKDEWAGLVSMHRGYYPLVDNQPILNGSGFRRSRALPPEETDHRQPMDKAIEYFAKTFPLITPEWSSWSAAMTPANLSGRWAVTANIPGKGPAFGEMTVTADAAPDTFITKTVLTVPKTGETIARTGKALVYTGYQWRGRGADAAKPDDPWREVMFVERSRTEMWGRWFTGAYDETGIDVKLAKISGSPMVLGLGQLSAKRGTSPSLTIYGINLPTALAASDVNLGPGITVRSASVSAGVVTAQVTVAPDAKTGPRDVSVGGVVKPLALVVYDQVDGIRVLPRAGLARTGGAVFPKGFQQFEAIAFANGPDGKPNTADDWPLGVVDATWGVEEYTSTFNDDDLRFVGNIDPKSGMFTPALDGPNPERSGNRNNIGDLWVTAEYAPEGAKQPIRARAQLVVSPPVYMRWMSSEVGK
ncbi:MAG: quinohemoprotein amine dehydrogenase subunit alpha [Acidobacteria bacterium]|nr:quinohemoprotein amine dehydrogenase subunit alpha [Acidobacteriota bacterium]